MSRVALYSVPWGLTQDEHNNCMSTCSDLINYADKDKTFLIQIIIGEETWRFLYNPQQSPIENHHYLQERRDHNRTGQKAS
jgi:hypothetical protein